MLWFIIIANLLQMLRSLHELMFIEIIATISWSRLQLPRYIVQKAHMIVTVSHLCVYWYSHMPIILLDLLQALL